MDATAPSPHRIPKTPGRGGKENNNDACAQRRSQKKKQKQDGTSRSPTNAPVVNILLTEPRIRTGTCGGRSPIHQSSKSAKLFAMRQCPEKIRCDKCIDEKKQRILLSSADHAALSLYNPEVAGS